MVVPGPGPCQDVSYVTYVTAKWVQFVMNSALTPLCHTPYYPPNPQMVQRSKGVKDFGCFHVENRQGGIDKWLACNMHVRFHEDHFLDRAEHAS